MWELAALILSIGAVTSSSSKEANQNNNDTVSAQANYIEPIYYSPAAAIDRGGGDSSAFYSPTGGQFGKQILRTNHRAAPTESNFYGSHLRQPQVNPPLRYPTSFSRQTSPVVIKQPEIIVGSRPKQPGSPNTSFSPQLLLDSGQVLLSKKLDTSDGNTRLETLSRAELDELLQRLKPLAASDADPSTEEQEDEEPPGGQVNLLGGDSSLVVAGNGNSTMSGDSETEPRPQPSASDEDLRFLRSLVDLNQDPRLPLSPIDLDKRREQQADDRPQTAYHPYQGLYEPERQQAANGLQSIPVDQLVDHLMSNSRLAAFGVQHEGLAVPSLGDDDEDDDEEEQDEDSNDADNGGAGEDEEDESGGNDPDESESHDPDSQEAESAPLGSFQPAPGHIEFDSVMNKSNSWVPLEGLELGKRKKEERAGEKNGRRRRRKRNKRRKKRSKPFGLVIGNRMLGRRELIKLIGILNRMASNKRPSKEREASRKLLRFLVRLMLDEYKRSKKPAATGAKSESLRDPIRDLLRSVLMGPVETSNDPKLDGTDGSIELRPLPRESLGSKVTNSTDDNDSEVDSASLEKSEEKNKTEIEQPRKMEPDEKASDESKEVKHLGLGELSDELEHYFDSDFFEDLADKTKSAKSASPTKTATNSSDVNSQKIELNLQTTRPGASKVSYKLPVPIYGRQNPDGDESDDIDPDLDVEHKGPSPVEGKRPARAKRRRQVAAKQRRRDRYTEPRRRRKRRKQRVVNDDDREPDEDGDDQAKADKVQDEDEKTADAEQDDDEQEEPAEEEHAGSEEAATPTSEDKKKWKGSVKRTKKVADDSESKRFRQAPSKRRRARPAAGEQVEEEQKRKAKSRRRKFESRYEIPAPIAKGPILSTPSATDQKLTKTVANKTVKAQQHDRADKSPPVIKLAPAKKTMGKKKPSTKKSKTKGKKVSASDGKRSGNRKRRNGEVGQSKTDKRRKKRPRKTSDDLFDERKLKKDDDVDYYNEGTSYSKICNDDDDCTVKVQSSNPKLRKAIENRNETSVVKHLDRWASEKPD